MYRQQSHSPAALIELVAIDNRLDVLARSGKIDVLQELFHRYIGNIVTAAPSLGATGAGVVLCQGERNRIGLKLPVFDRAMQIPRACLQVYLRIEELVGREIGDLIFASPFVGRFFGYLHEPTLPATAMLFRIEPALTPNDSFHEHGIELMFDRDDANEAVVSLKSRRAHPFVNRVNRVAR